jgi:tripartite-type tricarboxylate transporter receptor subunit TctC
MRHDSRAPQARRFRAIALATIASLATTLAIEAAHAAEPYPSRQIQFVVPFTAGGDADSSARNLAAVAAVVIGQPIVVLDRAGANGAIGSLDVKKAAPDGYTLLVGRVGSQVLLPALQPSTTPYGVDDFTPIGLLELNPVVCVVRPDSPYKTLADLVAALKANPGKLTYSHSGLATVPNLAPQLLLANIGLKSNGAVNVAYKGGNEISLAVISSQVDFACNNLSSTAGLLAGGKLRALVTTTPERLAQFPDVPTAREAGYPQLEAVIGWSALYGPPNMDPAAVKKWADVLQQVAKDPKWIAANAVYGGIPHVLSPEQTRKYAADSYAIYVDLVKKAGLEIK